MTTMLKNSAQTINPLVGNFETFGLYSMQYSLINYLTLFYTHGLGIAVLHMMDPQPYGVSLCFSTWVW
jgi:hypothetical protein